MLAHRSVLFGFQIFEGEILEDRLSTFRVCEANLKDAVGTATES